MFSFRKPHPGFVLAALLAAVLGGPEAPCLAQDETPGSGNPSLAAFATLREHIATEVREGRLPAEAATHAEEIGFSLETALIRADADIEISLLEAKRFRGEQQEAALAGLVRAVAERERKIFHHLRRLEEVAGVSAPAFVPAAAEESAQDAKSAEKNGKKSKIELEFKAEDLTKDPEWPL